jgi:predicted NAD/FAD-binding protein
MRPYIKGEDVEAYLVELTSELVAQRPTTGTFVAPALSTTERDALVGPARGMLVFNTTTGSLDYYNGASWGTIAAPAMTTTLRDAISGPVTGTLVFNTTTGVLNAYNGATWGAV